MTCLEARDAMLAADLSELRANASSAPLGAHLDGCAGCRSHADAILSATSRMGPLIEAHTRSQVRSTLSRRVALVALPIAAAILVVVTMSSKRPRIDAPAPSRSPLPAARHVSLTIAPGQSATVLKTADPTVTVIWLTPGDGQ